MAFSDIAEYSLKVRRDLLSDKWDRVTLAKSASEAHAEQVPMPAELAAQIEALKTGAITEWTPAIQDAEDGSVQSCGGGGCGCW